MSKTEEVIRLTPNRVSKTLKQLLLNFSKKIVKSSSVDGGKESYQCYRDVRYALVFRANRSQPDAGRVRSKCRSNTIHG